MNIVFESGAMLRPVEVAAVTGASLSSVYVWMRSGRLAWFKTAAGARIPDVALEQFMCDVVTDAVGATETVEA